MDVVGEFLRRTPHFKGKPRLILWWMQQRDKTDKRIASLPGGGRVLCDFSVPYEAMVWLYQEEQRDLARLCELLKPGDTFLDCGANIGIWSLVAGHCVGAEGRVFAFEPNPATLIKAQHNLQLSQCHNVSLNPFALSSADGTAYFQAEQEHNNSNLTSVDDGLSAQTITVETIRLDSFFAQADLSDAERISGIKIDVEGHELQVLEGASDLITKYRPWLCLEFNALMSQTPRLGDWPVHQFLAKLNYCAYPLVDSNSGASIRGAVLSDDFCQSGYSNLLYCYDEVFTVIKKNSRPNV